MRQKSRKMRNVLVFALAGLLLLQTAVNERMMGPVKAAASVDADKEPVLLKVVGANHTSANVISSAVMTSHVGKENFDSVNGVVTFQEKYFSETFGATDGLALSVYSVYGTVESVEVSIGTHTVTFGGEDKDLVTTGRWISNDYKKVNAMPKTGAKLKYAHNEKSSPTLYSFRFWEISENITITFYYTMVQAEVVDDYGCLSAVHYDAYPEESGATVEDKMLTLSSGYLRGSNNYSYRVAIRTRDDEVVTGFLFSSETGTCSRKAFLDNEAKKDEEWTLEGLGTVKCAYSGGIYYFRVKQQTTEKLVITPIVDEARIYTIRVVGFGELQPAVYSGDDFARHVAAHGGKLPERDGTAALLSSYSSASGLSLTVRAVYGTVESMECRIGEKVMMLQGEDLVSTTRRYADGTVLCYSHSIFGTDYTFRFFDIRDDITITVTYRKQILGDLNEDAKVTKEDVAALREVLVGAQSQEQAADLDQNGVITLTDLVRVKRFLSEVNYTSTFDSSLFYRNLGSKSGADPAILYVEDGEYAGTFFMYVTSKALGAKGFQVYSSKNLTDWTLEGTAFAGNAENWGTGSYWAPEVIYDDGLYYMFYSAQWGTAEGDGGIDLKLYASVAVSDNPIGPFVELATKEKEKTEPLLIFEEHAAEIPAAYVSDLMGIRGSGFIKVIDASPFADPQTGKKYLYFVADVGTSYTASSFIFGMEMADWGTPKYETLTKLTSYGKTTVNGKENISEGGRTNEGPFVYYQDGTYYLTFSTYTYTNKNYQVRQALGTSPLGPFTKTAIADGGAVLYTDQNTLTQASGHHVFFKMGEELWASYHVFANRETVEEGRVFAVDRIELVDNRAGQKVLRASGPTTTKQILPANISGYENIAGQAEISCIAGKAEGLSCLTDGMFAKGGDTSMGECKLDGQTTIAFTFSEAVTLRSILIYNSSHSEMLFDSIERITIYTENGNLNITELLYDIDGYNYQNENAICNLYDQAAVASFQELKASKIEFTFNESSAIGISEIMLLGVGQR